MKRIVQLVFFASLMFVLGGCAAKGPQFVPVQAPADKGVVFVYRESGFMGGGVYYDVHAGQELVCSLVQGGYCQYMAAPGELEIWGKTESKSSVTIVVEAGKASYVKAGVKMGFLVGKPYFEEVPSSVGAKEIVKCKLCAK